MVIGDAPSDWNSDSEIGLGGTRILNDFRSSGVLIGFVLDVISRKPSSQIRVIGCRPTLAMSARTMSPTLPSSAFQASSGFLNAKPILSIAAVGTSVARMLSPIAIICIAPERRLDSMWVSSPNWLFGNTCTSTSPLLAAAIFLAAALAATVVG